ncbi:arylsulfatase [Novosphingobium sp. 1529]|uniref:sulfatase-like hydrolase/transferase n=1 Tax=Novosphingobium sp. 1529 TaxID=3156424 RepID=UPI0033914523
MASFGLVPQSAMAAKKPAGHPNVLLIVLDDVGIDAASDAYPGLIRQLKQRYGAQGLKDPNYRLIDGKPASTPVLDRFAAQGLAFREAWAHPFCSPTRASMLTGLNANKTGVRDYNNYLTQHHHSLAQDLKAAGYSTAIFGKWHMAGLNLYPGLKPKEASFDLFRGNLNGAINDYWDYDYQVQDETTPPDQWRTEKVPVRALSGVAPTTYAPVIKVTDAIAWMKQQQGAGKPWFAWFAFNLSHITAGQSHPPTFVPNVDMLDKASQDEMKACGGQFGTTNLGHCSAPALNRAMINSMDTAVGKLLDALDTIDPNTYVIILGDNGTPMYGKPNINFIDNMYIKREGRGKGTGYESGTRVPVFVRGPGIKPGTSDAVVHTTDMFSTILDLAHVPVPKTVSNREGTGMVEVDARSLTPILFDRSKAVRDPVYGYVVSETAIPSITPEGRPGPVLEQQVAVKNATFKVLCIEKSGKKSCEFYNLMQDPIEEFPLKMPSSCPATVTMSFSAKDEVANYCFLRQAVRDQSGM